ncbi:hypothetical protein [Exiguobacterium sp. s193]|uniref:hypothetical protein n=1 Tax=Exiguobacterium sp. s193 TaxID=2751207 RepID=UPI001BE8524A|nr:hypothetical protein [Exiguobacterium sp. s193]
MQPYMLLPLYLLILLAYVIISLIDMWKSYTATSNSSDFLFFILTIVALFAGFLLAPILSLLFHWKRHRLKRNIGLVLFLILIIAYIVRFFIS